MHPYSAFLGPVDSAFYYVERPETPMNIGALVFYDGHIQFEALKQLIDSRVHRAPRYQQRIVQAPFNLGQPVWIFDPDFHIARHVRRVRLPQPATEAELRETVKRLLSCPLERDKPLWEIYLIEGLENQTAIFYKVHHCMVDGLAAVEIFTLLMDLSSAADDDEPKPIYDAPALPDAWRLTWDTWRREVPHRFSLLNKIGKESARLGSALFDPNQRLKTFVGVAHLISNTLKPIRKLPINGKNSGRQGLVWAEFALDEIHQIRKRVGASVNDVMLALMTATIARYSERSAPRNQPFLRVLMPVNIRSDDERGDYGNRISVLPVDIPLNQPPLERLQSVTDYSTVLKESMLSLTMDLVLTLPSLMPSVIQPSVWGTAPTIFSLLAHTWCTNVAATPLPVYLLGHEMQHVYGYFPLNPTMGLACVIVSYNKRITMTLVMDEKIIVDAEALQADLNEAYRELTEAAGIKSPVTMAEIPARCATNCEPDDLLNQTSPCHSDAAVGVDTESRVTEAVSVSVLEKTEIAAVIHVGSNGTTPEAGMGVLSHAATDTTPPQVITVAPSHRTEANPTPPLPAEAKPRYRLFSEEWAQALREAINTSKAYRDASTHWTSGALAFVMNKDVQHGYPVPAAVYLDLHRGVCRSASALSLNDAMQQAAFVIVGDYGVWIDILRGKASPLAMLSTGKLRLKRGSLFALLPHTRSANELVRCACRVPYISQST